jgi:phage terminase small subunit|tara:strand:+ start:180 stop:653 length:474 start_codon:yes stop_codon:yes gene_type:complete
VLSRIKQQFNLRGIYMEAVIKLEERKERDEEFVREYVNNGGNATQAAIAVGVSQASASTVGYRLKSRLTKEIDTEQKAQLQGYAPKAISQIQSLAEKAESENVRLKANADLLDRAGWKPIDKQEITETTAIEDMSDEELQEQLDALLAADGKKLVDV